MSFSLNTSVGKGKVYLLPFPKMPATAIIETNVAFGQENKSETEVFNLVSKNFS